MSTKRKFYTGDIRLLAYKVTDYKLEDPDYLIIRKGISINSVGEPSEGISVCIYNPGKECEIFENYYFSSAAIKCKYKEYYSKEQLRELIGAIYDYTPYKMIQVKLINPDSSQILFYKDQEKIYPQPGMKFCHENGEVLQLFKVAANSLKFFKVGCFDRYLEIEVEQEEVGLGDFEEKYRVKLIKDGEQKKPIKMF